MKLGLKILFLVAVLAATSGYRFRCWAFCTDQVSVQHDYVEQRDRCRDYAQLKLDMAMRSVKGTKDEKSRRTQLVNLFSECMAKNGWTVDDKAEKALASAPTPAPMPIANNVGTSTTEAETAAYEKASLTRASECAFARHAAAHSSIAAARAKACDLECAGRLSAAPDAPRPAACPSGEPSPELSKGRERDEGPL